MSALIDTNVAIHLRDRNPEVLARVAAISESLSLSIVSRVELESGLVTRVHDVRARRRASLRWLLEDFEILDFDPPCADAYARVIAVTGYSRPRTLDRMIAATALAHGASLITINAQHFRDIPGLDLIEWPSPGPAA